MYGKESNSITPDQIRKLAEEMKQINKNIDLKNPLISKLSTNIASSVLNENSNTTEKPIKERQLDVDNINKNKNIIHVNESEKDKWKRMMNYNIFDDENKEL
jgi:hypothetical protein